MYLRKFKVENIRSISSLEMDFDRGREAGWHVLLGPNGSGKSSFVRAFALLMMGEKEAYAARQVFRSWVGNDAISPQVSASLVMDDRFDIPVRGRRPTKPLLPTVTLRPSEYDPELIEPKYSGVRVLPTIWGGGEGWFSASFGPFRRFTGGDRVYDRLFVSNRRLAPHLSSLGEDVALTEALEFLTNLVAETLQTDKVAADRALQKLGLISTFIGGSGLLPHGASLSGISSNKVLVQDARDVVVPIDQLSDGYRSVLSLVIELIRQMFNLYGHEKAVGSFTFEADRMQIIAPGVVVIDEVDAHLHPDWQRDIGLWLRKCFPNVQFVVTTHSPIVCRAIAEPETGEITGSVWKFPTPGTNEVFRRVSGAELDQLAFGDVLDAYGTELFGSDLTQSEVGKQKVERLAELNVAALSRSLTADEVAERKRLRQIFPASSGALSGS